MALAGRVLNAGIDDHPRGEAGEGGKSRRNGCSSKRRSPGRRSRPSRLRRPTMKIGQCASHPVTRNPQNVSGVPKEIDHLLQRVGAIGYGVTGT
ncbi:MAG: hypothetical protein ACLPNY_13735, partial [Roseiarcus sp.]